VVDAVEAVCVEPAVLDHLEQLVDQSLLTVREEGGEARYRLLDTIREYALERLREAGEEPATLARHAAWYLGLAEHAAPHLAGGDQAEWLERLEREHDNLRTALGATPQDMLVRLAGALWKFWEVRGHAAEGLKWLETALAADNIGGTPRATVLHGAAILAWLRGNYDRAIELHQSNLQLRESLGDRHGLGVSLLHLANVMRSRGDSQEAVRLCRESLAVFRGLDDARWCGNALNSLGMALLDGRCYAEARTALEECLEFAQQIGGSRRIAVALGNLGDVARAEGRHDRAEALLAESLELFAEVKDAWGSSASLESLAHTACAQDQPQRAAKLFGAADGQRERAAVPLPPADRPEHDRAIATLRLRLGREAVARLICEGQRLSLDEAVAFALDSGEAREPTPIAVALQSTQLTDREREVAALVARGLTNRQIAEALVITKQTADKHVGNILSKLGAASRSQVAVWVVQQGLRSTASAS
jgi:DNA-binding CsgD family transcriptional regulator